MSAIAKGLVYGDSNGRDKETNTVESRADFLVLVLLDRLSRQEPAQLPTIDSLAASLNISPSYLRHIIKRKTGISFRQHIKALRLRQARQLLQETFWTVKQVMLEVGVSDHSHFAKDYKKEFGESPSQTRCQAIAGERRAKFMCATK